MKSDDYIETYTGQKVYILNPEPEQINIVDIAHSLSMMARFNGHSTKFYSVSEHSVYVSWLQEDAFKLHGLLHDAAEAYLADIPSPVKPLINNYKELEDNMTHVIFEKFGLEYEPNPDIKSADRQILRVEADQLMQSRGVNWNINKENKNEPLLNMTIQCLAPEKAKILFFETFNMLTG